MEMNKLSVLRFAVLVSTIIQSSFTFALPEKCIEDPYRREACPHIIYKTAMLPNKETGEETKQLVCVCLTDFKDLFTKADSEVKQKIKEMNLRSLSVQLGISEEKLKELVQYK